MTGDARAVAAAALRRIEQGAYANLVLNEALERSGLPARDRALATELVYGTTRMRRACDWLVDRFVLRPLDLDVRVALRLGAYQVAFLSVPAHAAVSATVSIAPARAKGLVNAILRRVADAGLPGEWPDEATRLSYPDWIVRRFDQDLGVVAGRTALEHMNSAPSVHVRSDGYTQDPASEWVAELAGGGDRVADICAGPGGKATGMAGASGFVVALDRRPRRAALVRANATSTGSGNVAVLVADGRRSPVREGSCSHVLVDAPCSGLGVLRRRPDARWRITARDVDVLAQLQRDLLEGAVPIVRGGGTLTFSVCTVTATETRDIDAWFADRFPTWVALPPPGPPWKPVARGALLLPQDADTDGMFVARYAAPAGHRGTAS